MPDQAKLTPKLALSVFVSGKFFAFVTYLTCTNLMGLHCSNTDKQTSHKWTQQPCYTHPSDKGKYCTIYSCKNCAKLEKAFNVKIFSLPTTHILNPKQRSLNLHIKYLQTSIIRYIKKIHNFMYFLHNANPQSHLPMQGKKKEKKSLSKTTVHCISFISTRIFM